MSILQVQHIEKHFGDTRVLEDISFELEQGQALAIIGSSGSGKTTLLRCLNFLETPDRGRILVRDKVLFDAGDPATQRESEIRKKRLHFGMVFQSFNLFPQYTALKNVTLAKELLAQERPDFKQNKKAILEGIEAEGRALLSKMGLAERAGHYPHQLSGGMLQRIMIGIATAMEPSLLIADEPTTAIDAITQYEILEEFIRIKKSKNTAMLFITHDLGAISKVADRILVMNSGQIVDSGDFEHIRNHANDPYTRLLIEKRSAVMCHYRDILHGKEISHA